MYKNKLSPSANLMDRINRMIRIMDAGAHGRREKIKFHRRERRVGAHCRAPLH